jgi:uncharacterized sporulation protein YeaH/YhbH (DUF444 family)
MSSPIDSDLGRFKDIVKGKVRKNLKKFMADGSLTGQTGGGKLIKIPLPGISIPHFTFGGKNGGAGQGDGEIGDSVGKGKKGKGNGPGAGEGTGDHMHTEMEKEELAQILQEELELPNIENKGKEQTETVKHKYNDISLNGPMGLRHMRKTYKNALKRSITSGAYDPNSDKPTYVVPEKPDFRYKHFTTKTIPDVSVMVVFVRDYSGSITQDMCDRMKNVAFWTTLWLEHAYKKIETKFIVFDTEATELTRDEFFGTSNGGGTRASSGMVKVAELVEQNKDKNIYVLTFSDGDNFGSDNEKCLELINQKIIPDVNLFCYGQCSEPHGNDLYSAFVEGIKDDKFVHAKIISGDDIMPCMKTFLGTGK